MTNIAVEVNRVDGPPATTMIAAPNPAAWTADDARAFVWAVWHLLQAHAGDSLQLRPAGKGGCYRLEFIAETGAAVTDPIRLSEEALRWLETVTFRLPADDRTH